MRLLYNFLLIFVAIFLCSTFSFARELDSWLNFNLNNTAKFLDISFDKIKNIDSIKSSSFSNISVGSSYDDYSYIPNVIVNNNTAYVINSSNNIVIVNLDTKKIIKKISLKKYTKSPAVGLALNDSVLYITFADGLLLAYSIVSEADVWTYKSLNPISSAPTVSSGKVFIVSNNSIFAINQVNGDFLWSIPGSLSGVGVKKTYAPSIYLGYLLAGLPSGDVLVIQEDSGNFIYRVNINNYSFTSRNLNPILGDIKASILGHQRNILVASNNKTAYYSLDDKKVLWQKNYGTMNTPLLIDDYFYIIDNLNNLAKINIKNGEKVWSRLLESDKKLKHNPTFDVKMLNGLLFVSSSVGDIQFFNAETGKILFKLDKPIYSSKSIYIVNPPVITSKYIVFLTSNGNLYIY